MNTAVTSSVIASTKEIPYPHAKEACRLLQTSFERLLHLLESLGPEDWTRPTPCTAWNVRDMAAHQAGGYASGTGYREMFRQYLTLPKPGQLPEDAINARQISERKNMSPAELIAELRQAGEKAIHNWTYGFRAIRWIAIPHPVGGFMTLHHLMWVIHSRDTWMHRLDICRATGRLFEQTREHDGRINELVIRDAAGILSRRLKGRAIALNLTGIAGGSWKIGQGNPEAEITMDVLDFNIFVSGRFSFEEGMQRASISGDRTLVEKTFTNLLVLY